MFPPPPYNFLKKCTSSRILKEGKKRGKIKRNEKLEKCISKPVASPLPLPPAGPPNIPRIESGIKRFLYTHYTKASSNFFLFLKKKEKNKKKNVECTRPEEASKVNI